MAIRYSGDVEIRLGWDPKQRIYRGSVRDPYRRWSGYWRPFWTSGKRTEPDSYDEAAHKLLNLAQKQMNQKFKVEEKGGRVVMRRVFQSPCPSDD